MAQDIEGLCLEGIWRVLAAHANDGEAKLSEVVRACHGGLEGDAIGEALGKEEERENPTEKGLDRGQRRVPFKLVPFVVT